VEAEVPIKKQNKKDALDASGIVSDWFILSRFFKNFGLCFSAVKVMDYF
jgi:hypothetical protein